MYTIRTLISEGCLARESVPGGPGQFRNAEGGCGIFQYYRNRLQQEFKQPAPNRVWVSDITDVRVKAPFLYIWIGIDLFSRFVLAYTVFERIDAELVLMTFDSAFAMRRHPNGANVL